MIRTKAKLGLVTLLLLSHTLDSSIRSSMIQTLDDKGLDEAANIIMDRYRVLADSSDFLHL